MSICLYVCVRRLANIQVRRSFGNEGSLRDDPNNGCEGDYRNERFVIYFFCPPGLPVVLCFVPRETRLLLLLFFLNSSPQYKLRGLGDCLFRAIKKFRDKTHPPSPMKVSIIYLAEKKKKITTPLKLNNNYSMSPRWIWSDKITNDRVARVCHNHFIVLVSSQTGFCRRFLLPQFYKAKTFKLGALFYIWRKTPTIGS